MSLKPTNIHMQKTIAMGTTNMSDAGDFGCDHAFGEGRNIHGKKEVSKKRHLSDEKRGLKHLARVTEHGEHGMNEPRDGKSDQF